MFYFESKVQPALGTYSLLVLVFWNLFLNFPCNFTFTNTRKRNSTVFITPESCVKRKKKSEFNIHLRTGKNIFLAQILLRRVSPLLVEQVKILHQTHLDISCYSTCDGPWGSYFYSQFDFIKLNQFLYAESCNICLYHHFKKIKNQLYIKKRGSIQKLRLPDKIV